VQVAVFLSCYPARDKTIFLGVYLEDKTMLISYKVFHQFLSAPWIAVCSRYVTAFVLATIFLSFSVEGSFAQRNSRGQTGKEACSYLETPALDDSAFRSSTLENQFNVLRDLRSRMADILPKQKARVEDRRLVSEKLRTEKQSLEESGSRPLGLPSSEILLKSQINETDARITSNKSRAAGPSLSSDEKDKLEDEISRLEILKSSLQLKLAEFAEETRKLSERQKALPQEIIATENALQEENSCLSYLSDLNSRVEQKTIELLIPASQKSSFRLYLSLIYAGIVLVVIIGFYWLALIDRDMRRTIFAQQSGIQFITLFSLVIAIILFGVLEILADKELTALLGGISGYILGKITQDRPSNPTNSSATSPKTVTSKTIGFTAPDQVTDISGQLNVFSVGDRIDIVGSQLNDGDYVIESVSSNAIQTREKTLKAEPASAKVRITVRTAEAG
jgi:hypothetical protein